MFNFKKKKYIEIPDGYYNKFADFCKINPEEEVENLKKEISALKDTSIKVGDKVMLKKDMTKVYEVESIREGSNIGIDWATAYLCQGATINICDTKYSLDNNKVYTQDQILPYREDSHLLAKEIKKLK